MTTSTFDTPAPLHVDVQVGGGRITVNAADTDVTVVTIAPGDPRRESDVAAAEQTVVTCDGRLLRVEGPRRRGVRSWFGSGPAVVVTIDVPTGSRLDVSGWSDTRTTGRLGDVVVDSAMGTVVVEDAASARVTSAMGDVTVAQVDGDVELTTSAGTVSAGVVGGRGRLKTSAGDVRVGVARGPVDLRTAAGSIRIGETSTDVRARTSAGEIHLHRATSGLVRLESSAGAIEIGVPTGTAAWLDLDAGAGRSASDLPPADGPAEGELTVEVHATTRYGDIRVHRSPEVAS